jgi:CheY-like chemotaxis protein
MKIIVADDSPIMRECIKDQFPPEYCVLECENGREAVSVYEIERPDWVLMDIDMPVLDGVSAAQEIITRWPDARIIFVTAFDEKELRQVAIRFGVGYVLKEKLRDLPRIIQTFAA